MKQDRDKIEAATVLLGLSRALEQIADLGDYGATKYEPQGWLRVPNGINRYTDAMVRHFLAEGREKRDPESGRLHATCVAFNALVRLELMCRGAALQPPDSRFAADRNVAAPLAPRDGQ